MSFTLDLEIEATAANVFEFISDFRTTPQWYSAVKRVERVGGGGGMGTRYLVYRDLPGGEARNEVEMTSYETNREVSFTSISGPTPFVYRYLIEPTGRSTELVLQGSISGAGLSGPAALLAPLAEGLFKRGMRDNLGQLKRLLEAGR